MKYLRESMCAVALLAAAGCLAEDDFAPEVEAEPETGTTVLESRVGPSSSQVVDLHTWYSPSRNDYMTTSQPAWHGSPGETRSPDYQWVRVEGRVFRPDQPRPPQTVDLHLWWNGTTRDNMILAGTADDAWARSLGFTHVRLEGYAFRRALAGTTGLSFHSGSDYAVTTDPLWYSPSHTYQRILAYPYLPGHWEDTDPDPAMFGYKRFETVGTRPLMVIVRNDAPSRAGTSNDEAFYDQLIFSGAKSIPGYFSANSYGKFTFSNAGVHEIITSNDGDIAPIRVAGITGVDFGAYDSNRDGTVTSDELALVVINKWDDFSGQTRPVSCTTPPNNSVRVCLSSVSFVGERVSFMTLAHELAHQLQMWHTYGPDGGWNLQATAGAATAWGNNDTRTFHMDPWHKIAWGWIEPRVVSVDKPATLETLYSQAAFGEADYHEKRPVVLFHPSRRGNEFFILEAREQDGAYDANVSDNGMAVWLVNLTADKTPADIFFQDDGDPELEHIFGVRLWNGPDASGNLGPRSGFGRFFRDGDGAIELSWGDGSAVGMSLEFEFTDASRRVGHVQIGHDTAFRARLDSQDLTASPGDAMNVKGVFGLPGPRSAYLYGAGGNVTLPVVRWRPEGTSRFTIPSWLPGGNYKLLIRGPRSSVNGNPVKVRID